MEWVELETDRRGRRHPNTDDLFVVRDADLPAQKLTFALVSGPAGLTVSSGGLLEWTPTEAQGPSTNRVVVRVSDDAPGSLSTTATFALFVREANSAPVFPATNAVVAAQAKLVLPLVATDGDLPVQVLRYALVRGPVGLTVSTNGILQWTPPAASAKTTNDVTVSVTDGVAAATSVVRIVVQPAGSGTGSEAKTAERTQLSLQVRPDRSLALSVVGPAGSRFTVESSGSLGADWKPVDSIGEIETLGEATPVLIPIPDDGAGEFRQFRLRKP